MPFFNLLATILPAIMILLLSLLHWRIRGSWLYPGAFFPLYWFIALLLVVVAASDFGLRPSAVWLILGFCIVFTFSIHIGTGINRAFSSNLNSEISNEVYFRFSKPMLLISVIAGLFAAYILVTARGYSIMSVVLEPRNILQIGREYASQRYAFGVGTPAIIPVLNVFVYFGSLIGGACFALNKTLRIRLFYLLPLFLGLLQSFLVNARTGLIWMFILFVSSYLSIIIVQGRHKRFLSKKNVMLATLSISAFALFFILIQVIRENSLEGLQIALIKARISLLSSPVMFSFWLEQNYDMMLPTWGTQSFGGAFNLLGFGENRQALGWEGMTLVTRVGTFTSNVFTAFRQYIEDFTLPGFLLFGVVSGVLTGIAYRKSLTHKYRWVPILTLFYSITLGSYLANWTSYTSIFVAWFLYAMLFIVGGHLIIQHRPIMIKSSNSIT